MAVRRSLYRSGRLKTVRVDAPVISVGDLAKAGTGKSPIVKHIAHFLRESCAKRVGIIMPRRKKDPKDLLLISTGIESMFDRVVGYEEAYAHAESLTNAIVICDSDRVRGARKAIELGAEVIVLDNAFQNQMLYRDLNILLLTVDEPHGIMVPIGRFKEAPRAARDADVVLLTGLPTDTFSNCESMVARFPLNPSALVSRAILQITMIEQEGVRQVASEELRRKKILAVSSIAKPERFHLLLESLGAEVIECHLSTMNPFDKTVAGHIIDVAKRTNCNAIIQTAKDAICTFPFFADASIPVFTLRIDYEIAKKQFYARISEACGIKE